MEEMYKRIRKLRESLGMSQDELAKKTGYTTRSMVTKIEAGEVDLSRSKIVAFAAALGTTPGYLMDGTAPAITNEGGRSEVDAIFAQLSPDNRAKLIELARLFLDAQRNSGETK